MLDLIRLLVILLLLPVVLLLIGPLLVLAAIRGRQWMGPIMLDSTRYGTAGRFGVLFLGIAFWLLVWSGSGWFFSTAFGPTSATDSVVSVSATSAARQLEPPSPPASPSGVAPTGEVSTPEPEPPSPTPVATATSQPATPTETRLPTPTPTPSPSPTSTSSPTFTPDLPATTTSLALENEATTEPDNVETVTRTPTPGPRSRATPVPVPTSGTRQRAAPAALTALDRRDVLAVVIEANQRLRETIVSTNEENIDDLGQLWQGKAFSIIDFAIETSDRYQQPRYVTFEYISSPQVDQKSNADEAIVITRERWRYGRGPNGKEEAFEFTYTLEFRDSQWVIVQYIYRNLPQTPTVTPTSTPALEY